MKLKTSPVKIVLASASASRKQQLINLGFDFTVHPSGIDEDIYKKKQDAVPLKQICLQIARAKVEKIVADYPRALILGGDQMAVLGSTIFNKAGTAQRAVQALTELQGKTHTLFTGLYMRYGEKSFGYVEVNKMSMRPLTQSQIKQYVKTAQPLECAGSYALERYGIGLFEKIQTRDQTAVIGFPLISLINQMIKWNIPVPFLDQTK